MNTPEKHLYYLSELSDYKIDSRSPDVSGWPVKDSALRTIGTVKNLLVNKAAERVVYLDVEVDRSIIDTNHDPYGKMAHSEIREFLNEEGENHIIIPIGLVDINMANEYVFTDRIDHTTFAGTKRIKENTPIVRSYETNVLDSYGRGKSRKAKGVDDDRDRLEKVKQRDRIGEYRVQEQNELDSEEHNLDWHDAENERSKNNEARARRKEEEDFYGRSEFDDSKFRR